jgi:hypothetical protein
MDEAPVKQKMSKLALNFPSLARADGVNPWDADAIDRWAAETPLSLGELVTARFLLAVWNPGYNWRCGPFNLMEALRIWDEEHHKAFLAWAVVPWWP